MSQLPSPDNWFGLRTAWELVLGAVSALWVFFRMQSSTRDAHVKIATLRENVDDRFKEIRKELIDLQRSHERQRTEDQARQDKRLDVIDQKLDRLMDHLLGGNRRG